ncbi:MAG: glycosyltransferase family 4 protein [Deltaproteobacteria bacterium]|nr:glycosyltransferase family 4 protein [Deltaproteobacteria bacterium]
MQGPKIFYFCYDHQNPTGGQKQVYRHVDILNGHGRQAFVLHLERGFRLTWFDNTTRAISLDEFKGTYQADRDVLVIPEDLGERILAFPGRKVIFNQNCYYGFSCFGLREPEIYPYLHPDIIGVFVVSDHNREYLSFAYPRLKIHRVYYGIDPERFAYRPLKEKKKMIACLPAKNSMEVAQVYHQLISRSKQALNVLEDYEWVFIQNRSETEVTRILGDALLFIFLSTNEGFGLMPLEAMASGSLVVAYDSGASSEFLGPSNSFLSAPGDVLGIVRTVERITSLFPGDTRELQAVSEAALRGAREYSLQREIESVVAAWQEITGEIRP